MRGHVYSLLASMRCPLSDGRSSPVQTPAGLRLGAAHPDATHLRPERRASNTPAQNRERAVGLPLRGSLGPSSLPQGSPGLCKHGQWWSSGSLHGSARPPPALRDPWSTPAACRASLHTCQGHVCPSSKQMARPSGRARERQPCLCTSHTQCGPGDSTLAQFTPLDQRLQTQEHRRC